MLLGSSYAITVTANDSNLTVINDGYCYMDDESISSDGADYQVLNLIHASASGALSGSNPDFIGTQNYYLQTNPRNIAFDGSLLHPEIAGTNANEAIETLAALISKQTFPSVAGSSDVTLTSGYTEANSVTLSGTITADISVIFPLSESRKWEVYNNTDGAYAITAKGATGTGVYLPNGTKTHIEVDSSQTNIVYGAASQGGGISWLIPVSLIGSVGTVNTALVKLPANFRLVRAEFRITTGLTGGTATLGLGTSSGGVTIVTSTSVGAAGTLIGDLTSQLGSDMLSTRGYEAFYTSATTIWMKEVISGSDVTVGDANLYLAGYMV
jgi:hypothetical protein